MPFHPWPFTLDPDLTFYPWPKFLTFDFWLWLLINAFSPLTFYPWPKFFPFNPRTSQPLIAPFNISPTFDWRKISIMKNVITPLVLFLFCISTAFAQPAKRILLEEFTGTWCGGCPEGTLQGEAIHDQYPQQCIQLSWHRLDSLTISENYDLQDRFNIYSYPTGMINRYRNPGNVYNPFQTFGDKL